MANIYTSAEQLIGKTPLLQLCNIEKELGLKGHVLVKLECMNIGGSVKDRVAKNMLDDAEKKGLLNKDTVIIEPTSGNTGIGLALVAAARGYKTIIVMPEDMTLERKLTLKAYGAELVLTEAELDMAGAIEKAKELHESIPNSIVAGQFVNPANPEAHYLSTGPEIWEDTDGDISAFVSGVGTGGTISGTGHYLKERKEDLYIVAVEPEDSNVISGGEPGQHNLQGMGAGFIPEIFDIGIFNEVMVIADEQAYAAARLMGRKEGVLIGITAGAALHAGIELAKRDEFEGKNIVVILPDGGAKYLSTKLYQD